MEFSGLRVCHVLLAVCGVTEIPFFHLNAHRLFFKLVARAVILCAFIIKTCYFAFDLGELFSCFDLIGPGFAVVAS